MNPLERCCEQLEELYDGVIQGSISLDQFRLGLFAVERILSLAEEKLRGK